MDQRRPKRAVKGHTRKHAKNAVESQCLIDVKAIVLTSSLQKTSRVGAYLCLVCSGKAHIPLEALQGEYTAYNARVIGEEERPYAAQDHEVSGPEGAQTLAHYAGSEDCARRRVRLQVECL